MTEDLTKIPLLGDKDFEERHKMIGDIIEIIKKSELCHWYSIAYKKEAGDRFCEHGINWRVWELASEIVMGLYEKTKDKVRTSWDV